MNDTQFVALVLSLLLGIIHFFSDKFKPEEGPKHYRIISFAAGISIAYLFLDLLPHTYEAAEFLQHWVFVFLLLGFAVLHLAEKYVYKHADQEHTPSYLTEIHFVSFFVYYFLVGIVVVERVHENTFEGVLFLFPIMIHAGLSSASLAQIHGRLRENIWRKIALSLSPILGVILAIFFSIPMVLNNILISLIAGALLYIMVKEFLPEKKEGQPFFFILGMVLFILVNLMIGLSRT